MSNDGLLDRQPVPRILGKPTDFDEIHFQQELTVSNVDQVRDWSNSGQTKSRLRPLVTMVLISQRF
jgi:hypothetical protein